MAGITDIEYKTLVRWLLPVKLRQPKTLAWLFVLCHPLMKYVYDKYKQWEQKSWYDIKYQTGIVQHLEYVLNDVMGYDPSMPKIKLGPGSLPPHIYVPLRLEDAPIYIGTLYVNRRSDYEVGLYDFSIIIHLSLEGIINEELVRSIADRYKRDGKNYKIFYETF